MAMKKEEIKGLLWLLRDNYPHVYKDLDEVRMKMLVNSWLSFFEDIPAGVMFKVAQMHVLNSDYPPTVKQLREAAIKILNPTSIISPEMAWEQSIKTIRKFGRYQKDDGMATLTPSMQRTVNAIGWDRMCNCLDADLGYLKLDFIKLYDEVDFDDKQKTIMPSRILEQLQAMNKQRQLEQTNNEPQNKLPEV